MLVSLNALFVEFHAAIRMTNRLMHYIICAIFLLQKLLQISGSKVHMENVDEIAESHLQQVSMYLCLVLQLVTPFLNENIGFTLIAAIQAVSLTGSLIRRC